MNDSVSREPELPEPAATIARLTAKLREDLAFAAPELWLLHIERRLAQAYEAAEEGREAAEQQAQHWFAEYNRQAEAVASLAEKVRALPVIAAGGFSVNRAAVLALLPTQASDSKEKP